MADAEWPEWPGLPGLKADLAAEDIDIRQVLRQIDIFGLSESSIDNAIRALQECSAASDSPSTFRPEHVTEFAIALNLREREGPQWLEDFKVGNIKIVALLLALVGRGVGALSTFTSVDMTVVHAGQDLTSVLGEQDLTVGKLLKLDPSIPMASNLHEILDGLVEFEFPRANIPRESRIESRTESASLRLGHDSASSLCANLGHKSSKVRVLRFTGQRVFGGVRACQLLAEALRSNSSLKAIYLTNTSLGMEGVRVLAAGLEENHTLESLDIGSNSGTGIGDSGTGYLAELLADNTSLKVLQMSYTDMGYRGACDLARALVLNTTLHTINLGGNRISKQGMTILLQVLTPASDVDGQWKNTTLRVLGLGNMFKADFSVESMALMIKRNTSLTRLELTDAPLSSGEWVEHIIPALGENATLKELDVRHSKGVTATGVLEALIDLAKTNRTALEVINVDDTPLSRAGMAGRLVEELRISKEYRSKFTGKPTRTPVCGRLVLCGYEFSGKTTICKTMRHIINNDEPKPHWGFRFKRFLKSHPGLRQCVYGKQASRELEDRTRGYEIVVLRKDPDRRTTAWDFAGQKEYYVLHDFMLPNARNTCFLFVCSAVYPAYHIPRQLAGKRKSQQDMETEFGYWLRFLASNSKPSSPPRVVFVLTHKDVLRTRQHSESSKGWANNVVSKMKQEFKDVIHLEDRALVVDAQSQEDIRDVLERVEERLKDLLDAGPLEFAVCENVRLALDEWAAAHPSRPIIKMKEFQTLCGEAARREMDLLVGADGRNPVLAYLNDVGDIIYPGTQQLDFLVVNPTWFGRGVLGFLIDAFRSTREVTSYSRGLMGYVKACLRPDDDWRGVNHEHGFVAYGAMEELLKISLEATHSTHIITAKELIVLMTELEMCFKEEPGNDRSRLFVPAVFDDFNELAALGKRQAQWKLARDGPFQHVGRRLQCANMALTFLSPGFFPRLQVVLRNYIYPKKWTENPAFQIDRNLIGFAEDGHEVLVEYSGDIDHCFVDVLARSTQSYSSTLKFVKKHVINKIQEFCASPQGCQGVVLVEAVIRPVCVEHLHLSVDRRDQAVLVSLLEEKLAEDPDERASKHTWSRQIDHIPIEDHALDLLEGKGSYDIFRRLNEQFRAQPSLSHGQQGSLDQLPRLFYPSIHDVGFAAKVRASIQQRKTLPITVHLMCHGRSTDACHEIEEQPGRILLLPPHDGGRLVEYAVYGLFKSVQIGAQAAVATVGLGAQPKLPGIDEWLSNYLSQDSKMPIPIDLIDQVVNPGRTPGLVSKEDILIAWKRFMEIDPSPPWFREFWNLADWRKFQEDFKVTRVQYKEPSPDGQQQVGWLCWKHYAEGLRSGNLVAV